MKSVDVFFYGLFMDPAVLQKNGINATNPRKGYLRDYALHIGNRASLLPSKDERSYGVVMTIEVEEVSNLYAQPSVADYVPEDVAIVIDANEVVPATCYNLPKHLLTGTNAAYAQSLYELAKVLGFPQDYLDKINKMG